jgi:hypothetical protein
MQQQALPAIRSQVCAITHFESRLDAKEEEMGVTDANKSPNRDLDRGLKCNRKND